MQNFMTTQHHLSTTLDRYLELEESRLDQLRQVARQFGQLRAAAELSSGSSPSFTDHPMNAYVLLARLTTDWELVQNLTIHNAHAQLIEQLRASQSFPPRLALTG